MYDYFPADLEDMKRRQMAGAAYILLLRRALTVYT